MPTPPTLASSCYASVRVTFQPSSSKGCFATSLPRHGHPRLAPHMSVPHSRLQVVLGVSRVSSAGGGFNGLASALQSGECPGHRAITARRCDTTRTAWRFRASCS
jgi:hypothetical protein